MLHIILLVLKIIGIVLLCILGLILLSVLCVLFVPVRYRVEVSREEGEAKPPVKVYIKITWFLHLVNILIRYPASIIVRARITLFTVFRIPGKEKQGNKKAKKTENKKISREHSEEPREAAEHTEGTQTFADENGSQEASVDDKFSLFEVEAPDEELRQKSQADSEDEEQSSTAEKFSPSGIIRKLIEKIKDFINKIKSTVNKIKKIFENIQYTIRNFCDKIKSTLDNIQYYREVMESDSFKQSMELCKGELGYVFRKLKPDKFEADLNVGMEDPATMGQILAVYGMLYPLIGQNVRLVADFESESTHIEGTLDIRGRIRAFTFLRVFIRVYTNKDIRKLIKLLKKEAV